MIFCRTAATFAIIAGIAVRLMAADPLPPESSLPGRDAALPPVGLPQGAMPGEASLPAGEPAEAVGDTPDESTLPPREPPVDDNPDDRFDEATPGDQRPILRLNYSGHIGEIRDVQILDGGRRMVSAGKDKDLHVWSRDPRDERRWVAERTIRWQVWRGPRGWINDLDVDGGRVAVGGYGAMGGNGEVLVFDVATGQRTATLVEYDKAHRQVIDSVAWSDDGRQMATADLAGRVVRWQSDAAGRWVPTIVADEDLTTHGAVVAEQIAEARGFHPIAWLGGQVLHPVLESPPGQGTALPRWRILRSGGDDDQPLPGTIDGVVADVRVGGDGQVIVAAALNEAAVLIWKRGAGGNFILNKIPVGGPPLFVSLDDDAGRLLVGLEDRPGVAPAVVRMFDLSGVDPVYMAELPLDQTAVAGCFDGPNAVVLAVGSECRVHEIVGGQFVEKPRQTLDSPIRPVLRVAASAPTIAATLDPAGVDLIDQPKPLRVAISRAVDEAGKKAITEVFDCRSVTLRPAGEGADGQFLPAQRLIDTWTVRPSPTDPERFALFAGDRAAGDLPLDIFSGPPTTCSTVATGLGNLVVVGTGGQNNVYVFDADANIPAGQMLTPRRIFRGHQQTVRSTSATADGRYLFSGGDDGLVMVWNLDAVAAEPSINRWGAVWTIDNGQLLVDRIDEAGPLYFRGVRAGDSLRAIAWTDRLGVEQTFDNPAAISQALADVPWTAQVAFDFDRQGTAVARFQMFPAWYPLATVMIDEDRNWAMWTPPGIYDASITGDRRFGWQLNRGLFRPVEFFRADQFRRTLQRPAVMRGLLDAGSLAGAMRSQLSGGPPSNEDAISGQIRSRPQIEILTPVADEVLDGSTIEVAAEVTCPPGHEVAAAKAFLDGIPGIPVGDPGQSPRRWRFALPQQNELQVEVIATTTAGVAGRQSVSLRRSAESMKQPMPRLPKLHLIALGVGRYNDSAITTLDFPARATDQVATTMRSHAAGLYDVTTEQLVDNQATRPLWRIFAGAAAERLKQTVRPDDLVVMYLCGHGLRDRRSEQWYFVTADAKYRDLMDDRYDDCLSLADLAAFADVPCRKLAIIDSCHSGAIQTRLRPDDLRTLLRFLQDDVVMTLTASEGGEEAAEVRAAELGRFTARIIDGLRGQADMDGDSTVLLRELVNYVADAVARDAAADGMSQHPVAAPAELIERLILPLTRSNSAGVAVRFD